MPQSFDERAFLHRVEAADADEFARIIDRATPREEQALRAHLGDERFDRMQRLAADVPTTRSAKQGKVVVIHGIMGGELSTTLGSDTDRVWLHYFRLALGGIRRLQLNPNGDGEADTRLTVRATGMLKRWYGEQLLHIGRSWDVRPFWFDWRRDLRESADALDTVIANWASAGEPVHIVAHSMGGLVARTFIARHGDRWNAMWDVNGSGRRGGRLIMLGTPNHGSYAVPQIMTGLEGTLRKLARLDLKTSLTQVSSIANTFPGSYQMLPSPLIVEDIDPLYRADAYPPQFGVAQHHLDTAWSHHELLRDVVDPQRMVYVAGYGQPTFCGITDYSQIASLDSYEVTLAGDGRVPHVLGLLDDVPTYYVEGEHGALPENDRVLRAMNDLLASGTTSELADAAPSSRGALRGKAERDARAMLIARQAHEEDAISVYARQLAGHRTRSGGDPVPSDAERLATELLVSGWVGGRVREQETSLADAVAEVVTRKAASSRARRSPAAKLKVALVRGGIEHAGRLTNEDCDVVAVGHYVGLLPQYAEGAIDDAISRALAGVSSKAKLDDDALLLTSFTKRGTIQGELGRPFLLEDPRRAGRTIAIAGMGVPGRFGAPELTVLVRELCWAAEQLGKRHIATVLIGAGEGNLTIREAVRAWVRGLEAAQLASERPASERVQKITFIELNPARIQSIDDALLEQRKVRDDAGAGMRLVYEPWTDARLRKLAPAINKRLREEWKRQHEKEDRSDGQPTRVTLEIGHRGRTSVYRFGAITSTAAVPEREVPIDQSLIDEANDRLPQLSDFDAQLRQGRLLERLLVPRDLRAGLSSDAPLVMVLDAAAARIHWEMVAQPDAFGPGAVGGRSTLPQESCFLGTSRGFTRQLRTTFAPPPEAPAQPHDTLRVLVVADPAADARLPGAMREGREVATLFERFNDVWGAHTDHRVEVVRLLGPANATRTAVLDKLFSKDFDVLHFAGHCYYDADEPSASGWIFGDGTCLSANELNRIDRIPKFVFSNACESGITPDRADLRNAALAPSFAEAFFARGVANFVCTAWPVDDGAALSFALQLYSGLLGIDAEGKVQHELLPMHIAMRDARLAIAATGGGASTWGAYQHYGNPFFRFFERLHRARPAADASQAKGKARRKRKPARAG